MNREVSELPEKALSLPPEARAALAGSLLESLDDQVEANAEEEWNLEIARRIQELDSGTATTIPSAGARRQIAAMLWPVSRRIETELARVKLMPFPVSLFS